MAKKSHFQKTNDRNSVLVRESGYRDNCNSGYRAGLWEAHHILCKSSLASRNPPQNPQYIEDCLWITDWNLNDSGNLIGLPKKQTYTAGYKIPLIINLNLPAHNVDHNTSDGYTKEVTKWLNENVWNTLCDKQKAHDVNAKDIQQALKTCTNYFKAVLLFRGQRKKGTSHCWSNRFDSSENYEKKWYYPFSMAEVPRKRSPGVDWDKLANIFVKL